MIKPVFIIAFSGHRPEPKSTGRTEPELEAASDLIEETFTDLSNRAEKIGGIVHIVCSLAVGSDIIACEAALRLGIPLHIFLPKPESSFLEEDFGGSFDHWRHRAELVLSKVRPGKAGEFDPRSTCRVAAINSESPGCYATVNVRMLETADVVVTIWNGGEAESEAGTGHVIIQADALELPRINLNLTRLGGDEIRRDYRLERFADSQGESLSIFKSLETRVGCGSENQENTFEQVARCLDTAAERSSHRFRSSSKRAILCHAAAGFLAAVSAAGYQVFKDGFHDLSHWVWATLALTELALVGYAFSLELFSKWAKTQGIWLDCRFAREIMRSLETSNPFLDPLFPEVRRHRPKWERFGMSCALQIRAQTGPLDSRSPGKVLFARDEYLRKRIDDQIGHFKRKKSEAHLPSVFFNKLAHWAGPLALVVMAIAFFGKGTIALTGGHGWSAFLKEPWLNAVFFLFLPIFVPLVASLGQSFLGSFDFGRRVHRYRDMVNSLEVTRRWMATLETLPNLEATARRTEEVLLDENIEWLTAQQSGFGH